MIKMKEIGKKVKEHVVRNRGKYCFAVGTAATLFLDHVLLDAKGLQFGGVNEESPFPERPIGMNIRPVLKIGLEGQAVNCWVNQETAHNIANYLQDKLAETSNS